MITEILPFSEYPFVTEVGFLKLALTVLIRGNFQIG